MNDLESVNQGELVALASAAQARRQMELRLAELTTQLDELNRQLDSNEQSLCDMLMEMGVGELKLTTGEKITMSKFYSASISEENAQACFDWLKEHGHDSLIKNEIRGNFGKGEDERAKAVLAMIETMVPGVFSSKKSVHAMTLKSFVKEQVESGTPFPMDIFKVFIGNKIKIK